MESIEELNSIEPKEEEPTEAETTEEQTEEAAAEKDVEVVPTEEDATEEDTAEEASPEAETTEGDIEEPELVVQVENTEIEIVTFEADIGVQQLDLQVRHSPARTGTPVSPPKSPPTLINPATPTTRANLEPSATVKYLLEPSKQVITLACSLKMHVKNLREQIASHLKMDPTYVKLLLHDAAHESLFMSNDSLSLADLHVHPNGIIQFKVESTDPEKHPIGTYEPPSDTYASPDFITVRVMGSSNAAYKEINVEIERLNHKRPFLGGFRNKLNQKEYLNAAIQTNRIFKPDNGIPKFSRDAQTVVSHHTKLQTRQDMSTQMTRPGVFISRIDDKLLTPRPYLTAEKLAEIQTNAAVVLQKNFRRWQALRRFTELKLAFEARVQWERDRELERQQAIEARRQWDIQRRMQPRTRDDFEVVYAALERWRREEMARIEVQKKGAARKAALAMLVDQEAELIGAIERCKLEVAGEMREKKVQSLLDKMAKPKIWKYKNGTTTELDTPYNIRARELKDIYNSLNMSFLTQDERLDVLLTLKHTIKEHDCKLTQDIISLIDREADLLMRGIKEENLQGLRKRIVTLFLQYIKTPQFNPAAARVLKVPQDLNVEKSNTFYCTTCQRYLPSHEFQVSSSSAKMGKCRTCINLENVALKRIDFTKFRHMLNRIQKDEQNFGSKSTICYLLTERDIQYMFETIWNSQSVLSANDDIYQLHFVRWNREEEWTPWNTILLTLEEADSHLKLINLELSYGDPFIKRVKQKHVSAKSFFLKLPIIADHFSKSEFKNSNSRLHLPSLTGIKINN